MFGLSLTHLILLGVIALIFIGPDQLPEVARMIGRFLNELRRSSEEIKSQFKDAADFKVNDPDYLPRKDPTPEDYAADPHQRGKKVPESTEPAADKEKKS